jgi:hypothetical protein
LSALLQNRSCLANQAAWNNARGCASERSGGRARRCRVIITRHNET